MSNTNILFHFLQIDIGGKDGRVKEIELDLDSSKLSLQMGKPFHLERTNITAQQIRALLFKSGIFIAEKEH